MRGTNKYTDDNMREIEVNRSTKMRWWEVKRYEDKNCKYEKYIEVQKMRRWELERSTKMRRWELQRRRNDTLPSWEPLLTGRSSPHSLFPQIQIKTNKNRNKKYTNTDVHTWIQIHKYLYYCSLGSLRNIHYFLK